MGLISEADTEQSMYVCILCEYVRKVQSIKVFHIAISLRMKHDFKYTR